MDDLQKAKDLKKRLSLFRRERHPDVRDRIAVVPSFSWGLRLGMEWVASVLVGLCFGYGLDSFFHIKPWGLMLGLVAGTAGGFANVYRTLFPSSAQR